MSSNVGTPFTSRRGKAFLRPIRFAALVAAVWLISASTCEAAGILGPTRPPILLPEAVEDLKGFTVQLDVGQEYSPGYFPVRIRIQSTSTFPADRKWIVRFRSEPQLESPPQNGLIVDVPVAVNQGSASETTTRFLPSWTAGQAWEVTIIEDGRPLQGYAAFVGGEDLNPQVAARFRSGTNSRWHLLGSEYLWNCVFISETADALSDSLPDLTALAAAAAGQDPVTTQYAPALSADALTAFWNELRLGANLHAVGTSRLPDDWRAYQRFDIVVTNREALSKIQPLTDEFDALRSWILNGGTIVTYDMQSEGESLDLLGFTLSDNTKQREQLEAIAYDWSTRWGQSIAAIKPQIDVTKQSIQNLEQLGALSKSSPMSADGSAAIMSTENNPAATDSSVDETLATEPGLEIPNLDPSIDPSMSGDLVQDLSGTMAVTSLDEQLSVFREQLAEQERELDRYQKFAETSITEWAGRLQVQAVGAGYVVSIRAEEGRTTPTPMDWTMVVDFLDHRVSPMIRRGVDPMIGDQRFSKWAIPGVAQPPVYTFIGLLTAFVILVGPVAYRRTSKIGRSYLMFAIAPLLAGLTTIAMFTYGILSDGFGTRARIRQLTWVDGASGDAGERVRSTYFAGVRPADGLQFSGDTELMIYREGTGQSWEDLDRLPPSVLGEVRVEADRQVLQSTFLPSRQLRQFITHRPRHDVGYLQLNPDVDQTQPPEIASGFSFEIQQVVVRDKFANYWFVESLDANSAKQASPLTTREASKLLGKIYNDFRPISDVRETSSGSARFDNETYDVIVEINRRLENRVQVYEGLFELWLQQNLQTNGDLPNESFVSISTVSPDVIAVDETEVRASVRYVFGTLR